MEKFQQNSYWFPLSCVQVSYVQDLTEGTGGRNKQEMNGLSYNVKVFHFSLSAMGSYSYSVMEL